MTQDTEEPTEPPAPTGPCQLTIEAFFFGGSLEYQGPEEDIEDIPEEELPDPEELFDFEDPAGRVNEALEQVYEGPEDCFDVPVGPPLE
jgi:hypothetical protein